MDSKLIVVFKGNPTDSESINQLLNDSGILARLKNQFMGTIAPWHVSPGGINPVEVEVHSKDLEKALKLIEEFKKSK